MLVDVYHYLCVYRYFSRLLFEKEAFNTFEQRSVPVFIEVFIFLSRPDSSYSRVDFSTHGSTFQLIGSSRSVEIFAASPSSSTSGSKAYFLFKLHDPTSGESGREQQLTTRPSSCILDRCAPSPFRSLISIVIFKRFSVYSMGFWKSPSALYAFTEISIASSFSRPITDFYCNLQIFFIIVHGFLEVPQ